MIILGIDPGLATIGYGVITTNGNGKYKLKKYGWIKTSPKISHFERLNSIYIQSREIIKEHKPDAIALEQLFFYNNSKTAMNVSQAMGVMKLAIFHEKIESVEYPPLKVKMVLTNNGKAKKEDIKRHIKRLLHVSAPKNKKTHFDDAADALGIAICHARICLEEGR